MPSPIPTSVDATHSYHHDATMSSSPVTDGMIASAAELGLELDRKYNDPSPAREHNGVINFDTLFRTIENTQLFQESLAVIPDINTFRDHGWTLLHLAAFYNAIGSIELLLKRGADVNIANDEFGDIALHLATRNGYVDVVQMLLHSGSGINLQNRRAHTALHLASQQGHSLLISLLLEHGANIDIADIDGNTALICAAMHGHHQVVEDLLCHKANVNKSNSLDGGTALHFAARNGHVKTVASLLGSGSIIDIQNEHGNTPLLIAAECGHLEVVEILLQRTADPNIVDKDGDNALIVAAMNCHYDIVKILLDYEANIVPDDFRGNTALHSAVQESTTPQALLDKKWISTRASPGSSHGGSKNNPVAERFVKTVDELINRGGDINATNHEGVTPLMVAVSRIQNNGSMLEYLIKCGADVNVQDRKGSTCMHHVRNEEGIRVLLKHRLGINTRDFSGQTPLLRMMLGPHWTKDIGVRNLLYSAMLRHGADRSTVDLGDLQLSNCFKGCFSPTPADILYVSSLLAKKGLPVKLTDLILEQAEYWARITTTLDTSLGNYYTTFGGPCGNLILRSKPICSAAADGALDETSTVREPRDCHPVRRITWTITSHDQGGNTQGGDTYKGSPTGFWGSVLRYTSSEMCPSQGAQPQHNSQEYLSAWDDIQRLGIRPREDILRYYTEGATDELRVWSPGTRGTGSAIIQLNRRTVKEAIEHVIIWDTRDCIMPEDPRAIDELVKEGRGVDTGSGKQVRALRRGDVVELRSFALLPGWINFIGSAQLVIEFAM